MNGKRLPELDVLKALGAFFVLMYHSQALSYGIDTSFAVVWVRALFSTCCPLFFFVSGVLALRGGSDVRKCAKSAGKLFLLTLFWAAVAWPVLQLQHGGGISVGKWLSGVMTLELWRTNVFWFLPVLAALQLLRPIVCSTRDYDNRLFHYLLVGALSVSFGYDALSRCLQVLQWISGSSAPMKLAGFIGYFMPLQGKVSWALGYFLLGVWVSERGDHQRHSLGTSIAAVVFGPLVLAAYGVASMHFTGKVTDVTFGGYGFAGTAVAVLGLHELLISLRSRISLGKVFQLIGENALAVYVLPWFVTYPLAQLVLSSTLPVYRTAVACPICLALIIGAALTGSAFAKTRVGKCVLTI